MEWNKGIKILEEKADYTLFYEMIGAIGLGAKFYFQITTSIHVNNTKTIYYEFKNYDSKSVPTTMKEVEKVLRKSSKKLIKRMKKKGI